MRLFREGCNTLSGGAAGLLLKVPEMEVEASVARCLRTPPAGATQQGLSGLPVLRYAATAMSEA